MTEDEPQLPWFIRMTRPRVCDIPIDDAHRAAMDVLIAEYGTAVGFVANGDGGVEVVVVDTERVDQGVVEAEFGGLVAALPRPLPR